MPQGPLRSVVAKQGWRWSHLNVNQNGGLITSQVDNRGATNTALNIDAPQVLKTGPASLASISVVNPGTAGQFVLNDTNDIMAVDPTNIIWIRNQATLQQGDVFTVDLPVGAGLTVSEVATDGILVISFGYPPQDISGGWGGIYYQPHAPVPTLPGGAPLPVGALWSDTEGGLFVWSGTAWEGMATGW